MWPPPGVSTWNIRNHLLTTGLWEHVVTHQTFTYATTLLCISLVLCKWITIGIDRHSVMFSDDSVFCFYATDGCLHI